MLHLQRLSKSFGGTPVFRDVGFAVARGEFVALVGESGVGKSTLLNCIAGLDSVSGGSVRIAGTELTASPHSSIIIPRRFTGQARASWIRA